MALTRICAMLESCAGDAPPFPPTLLYNEGWLLRLVMDWFSANDVPDHRLSFAPGARWYSEALLPSAFLARYGGDPLAGSWAHADGAIGHFAVGKERKTDLSLLPDAQHFVALEAKLFSRLSSGVTNARYFDQAARNVACVAEVLRRAHRHPSSLSHLGFHVVAPQSQIDAGVFAKEMDRGSIGRKVKRRVAAYAGAKDQWYEEWFQPTLGWIHIDLLSWEALIQVIGGHDPASGVSFGEFYSHCLRCNEPASRKA
jgi:hypothetical protein